MPNHNFRRIAVSGMIFAYMSGAAALTLCQAAETAPPPVATIAATPSLSYSDTADLALAAQVVAGLEVVEAERLKGELAPGLAPGFARFLINANVQMLLKGADGMAGAVSYVADVPLDAKGKAPKLKKMRFLAIASRVPNKPQVIALTSPYSHLAWTQNSESRLRAILGEASKNPPPPRITGVGNAFFVPGAIPGESEAQIFLQTADNRPISLSVLRRPGERPQWAVALSEIVDDGAVPPTRDTLLWYRLACFLPRALPERSARALSAADADAVRKDYGYVIEQLGSCGRTIPRPAGGA
jgi:hypothetical protein